jgi:CheY-like chemotaxis protein
MGILRLSPINARFNSTADDPLSGIPKLQKPLRIGLLRERLDALFQLPCKEAVALVLSAEGLRSSVPRRVQDSAGSSEKAWHPRLLLVEDNPVNRKLALSFIRRLGYDADIACNGLEAISSVTRNRYDLILMDCQMPELDGYGATQEIRQRERNTPPTGVPPIRILALTANAMSDDEKKCLDCGMDGYISKPISFTVFRTVLENHLQSIRPTSNPSARPDEHSPVPKCF